MKLIVAKFLLTIGIAGILGQLPTTQQTVQVAHRVAEAELGTQARRFIQF